MDGMTWTCHVYYKVYKHGKCAHTHQCTCVKCARQKICTYCVTGSRSFWSRSFGSGTLRSQSFGSGTLRSQNDHDQNDRDRNNRDQNDQTSLPTQVTATLMSPTLMTATKMAGHVCDDVSACVPRGMSQEHKQHTS